ncbi:hypothetical protein MUG91_G18n3 [Manis pentadactyla]|nr:hypothetical protein MUG91_G18n3 [Manis pentadactyla]
MGTVGNVVWRPCPPRHSCNGCFLEGAVTWNFLASAPGAPGRAYFKLELYIYRFFVFRNLQSSRSSHVKIATS